MSQIEREYKNALDDVRFSEAEKERMMNNLMNQKEQEQAQVGRRGFRPLRAGLIAAAACAALVMTAGAATIVARQANINFLGSYGEAEDAQKAQQGDDSLDGAYGDLKDYDEGTPPDMEALWNGEPGATLVEETVGTDGEGWTAKRVIQYERDGKTYQSTMYKAEAPSGYNSLWKSWDTSWLEEHYAANHWGTFARTITYRDKLRFLALGGEYQDGETRFNIGFSWNGSFVRGDEYRVAGNKEYAELYTTPDGVEVAIEMDTSDTGKSVFWASVEGGHNSFSMFGTQMEVDALHGILDSLNLSTLLEYAPE